MIQGREKFSTIITFHINKTIICIYPETDSTESEKLFLKKAKHLTEWKKQACLLKS